MVGFRAVGYLDLMILHPRLPICACFGIKGPDGQIVTPLKIRSSSNKTKHLSKKTILEICLHEQELE